MPLCVRQRDVLWRLRGNNLEYHSFNRIVDIVNSSTTERSDLTVLDRRMFASIKSHTYLSGRKNTTEYHNEPAGTDSTSSENRRALKPQRSCEATNCYEKVFGQTAKTIVLTKYWHFDDTCTAGEHLCSPIRQFLAHPLAAVLNEPIIRELPKK